MRCTIDFFVDCLYAMQNLFFCLINNNLAFLIIQIAATLNDSSFVLNPALSELEVKDKAIIF